MVLWSCEHCGRPEDRQAERECVGCGESMCVECTEKHDDAGNLCPAPPMVEVTGDPPDDGDGLSASEVEALDAMHPDRHRDEMSW